MIIAILNVIRSEPTLHYITLSIIMIIIIIMIMIMTCQKWVYVELLRSHI